MLKKLDWDSDFFGFSVGMIDLTGTGRDELLCDLRAAGDDQYRLIYLSVPATEEESNRAALGNGGYLASRMVSYTMMSDRMNVTDVDRHIEPYNLKFVTPRLLDLALQSGHRSRFRTDPRFETGKFGELYSIWISRSVSGELADLVVVYVMDETIRGFATVKCSGNSGKIGLISVDSTLRGMNIGTGLINYIKRYCISKECTRLDVDTQYDNEPANRFYKKCGFNISSDKNIYHFWL